MEPLLQLIQHFTAIWILLGDEMLLGNRTVYQKSPVVFRNGNASSAAYSSIVINNFTQSGRNRNIFSNDFIHKVNSVPIGYSNPYNFLMAQKAGGIASLKQLSANISTIADVAAGKNAESNISASIVLSDAQMGLIVSAISDLSASISVTDAGIAAVLDMIANGITASGSLNAPTLGAISDIIANLIGSGEISSGTLNDSPGFMTSDITPYTELSPESLAAAVLNAILADYNASGSVGEALNNIGASSNPWDANMTSNSNPGTMGEQMAKLLTIAKYMGLK
jgi:hypothetical protein